MGDVHPAQERHARLYLHLAERFGWTPEQVNAIDSSVRQTLAKVLNLPPHGDAPDEAAKQPVADAPAEPEGLAEWERDLLAKQDPDGLLTDAEMRAKVRNGEWTVNRYRDALGLPTAPSATTSAQDAGITLTVHLDGKTLYDAIRPHSEAERARWRMRHGRGLIDLT